MFTKNIIFFLFIILSASLYAQNSAIFLNVPKATEDRELDALAKYATTLSKMTKTQTSMNRLRNALYSLNNREIEDLEKYLHRENIAIVYIYASYHLENELSEEQVIDILEKSVRLRGEPNTIYKLAKLYKKKYDESIYNNKIEDQMYYGRKVYASLKKYTDIVTGRRKSFEETMEHFSYYNPKSSKETN